MKFAANITTLFQDITKVGDKYLHYFKKFGGNPLVDAIECQDPYSVGLPEWLKLFDECKSEHKVLPKWVLINSPPIFSVCSHVPTIEEYEEKVLKKTLDYALTLKVPKVHLVMQDVQEPNDFSKIKTLLQHGTRFMGKHNILCVIEPLCIRPNYYLRSYQTARELLSELNEPNLKVLVDTFHMQKLHGNLTENIKLVKDMIGHVQISQTPGRVSPFSEGEVNHEYILKVISQVYKDYVGLEYFGQSLDVVNSYASFSNL